MINEAKRADPEADFLLAEHYVRRGAQVVAEFEILIDGLDSPVAGFLGAQVVDGVLVEPDLASVRLQHAAQYLDERALACPVVADQSNDLPRVEIYRHAGQRAHTAKELGNPNAPYDG